MNKAWHKADIKAALEKAGWNYSSLSRANGLKETTISNALTKPWAKGEIIIANAIGVHPSVIWPDRWLSESGKIIDRRMRKNMSINAKL